jgi:hypothetical protein
MASNILAFPSQVIDFNEHPSFIQFDIMNRTNETEFTLDQHIILMMPENVRTDAQANWEGVRMGFGGKTAQEIYRQTGSDQSTKFKDMGSGAVKIGAANVMAGLANMGGSDASGLDILGAGTNIVMNPYLTAVYRGENLRQFNLMFSFFPKNERDCIAIYDIIATFENSKLPKKGTDTYFLGYPSEFKVSYKNPQGNNPWLPNYERCVLVGMGVDYTGVGFFGSLRNGFPIQTILTLGFMEIEAKTIRGTYNDSAGTFNGGVSLDINTARDAFAAKIGASVDQLTNFASQFNPFN